MTNLNSLINLPQYGKFSPSTFSSDRETVLINWNSEEGLARLRRSNCKQSFYQLINHFEPQINPLYCGIATSVIILNALRIPNGTAPSQQTLEVHKPNTDGLDIIRFPSYSQWTFLNSETDNVKPRSTIRLENAGDNDASDANLIDPGLNLDELKGILEIYSMTVEMYYADKPLAEGVEFFRETVKSVLGTSDQFLITNFVGNTIGTTTGGHISPLGAYDSMSDSVLIIDVATHKNPWYWTPITHLYQAMNIVAKDKSRGWLVVSDGLETA